MVAQRRAYASQEPILSLSLGQEPMTRLSFMAEQPIPWPGKLDLASKVAGADAAVAASNREGLRASGIPLLGESWRGGSRFGAALRKP